MADTAKKTKAVPLRTRVVVEGLGITQTIKSVSGAAVEVAAGVEDTAYLFRSVIGLAQDITDKGRESARNMEV